MTFLQRKGLHDPCWIASSGVGESLRRVDGLPAGERALHRRLIALNSAILPVVALLPAVWLAFSQGMWEAASPYRPWSNALCTVGVLLLAAVIWLGKASTTANVALRARQAEPPQEVR